MQRMPRQPYLAHPHDLASAPGCRGQKSQQERVSLYSAAGGLQTSGPALDSEAEQGKTCELQNLDHHDWDAINSAAARGVNANEGPYGPMLLHVSVQRNKSNTIVIFKVLCGAAELLRAFNEASFSAQDFEKEIYSSTFVYSLDRATYVWM